MDFWIWVIIALCFVVYVTILFTRAVRGGKPFWKSIKEWIINVIEILSGGA